jgi:hypothetical protein
VSFEAPFVQIGDQRRQAGVQHGPDWFFMRPGKSGVMVPRVIVGIGDLRPDDFDNLRPGLHQPPRQEAALAERVAAIALAQFRGFFVEVESIPGASRKHQPQRLTVVFIECRFADGVVEGRHAGIDHVSQFRPAFQPCGGYFGPQFQVVDVQPVHLRQIHVVPGGEERVRVVGPAQKTGRSPLADHIALLQWTGHHHERQHGDFRRLQPDDVGTHRGVVGRAGRLQLAGRADLVSGVPGVELVNGGRVIEQPDRRVAHRPDHGELVVHLRQLGEDFRELHPRQLGVDRLEDAFDIIRDVVLGIPQIRNWSPQEERGDGSWLAGPGPDQSLFRLSLAPASASVNWKPAPPAKIRQVPVRRSYLCRLAGDERA